MNSEMLHEMNDFYAFYCSNLLINFYDLETHKRFITAIKYENSFVYLESS